MTDSPRPPLNWRRQLYHSMVTFDTSKSDLSSGLRVAALTTVPLIVGLATNQTSMGLTAALGAFNVSMPELPRCSKLSQLHILGLACVVNAFAFAAGTLVGMTGPVAIPLFGIGFFVAGFLAIYSDVAIIGSVACVLFSIGVGLPGGGTFLAA